MDWDAIYIPCSESHCAAIVAYGEPWPSACLWIVPGTYAGD